jgi:RNA polymerase sigma factor (sigma-70 family)
MRANSSGLDDEREFVAAILRKDRKATAEFVARFADPVHSFVRWRLAPSAEAVEDIVQEVFLEAWRSLPRYRGDSGLRTWILGIARHKVQDHYRSALRDAD